MSGRDILISGTPRSGTTLSCFLLSKLPDVVALHEPMRIKDFTSVPNRAAIADAVADFAAAQRRSILTEGKAVSKNSGGQVPDNPIARTDAGAKLRESVVNLGEIAITKPLTPEFTLAIKHNGAFAAAIDVLVERFPLFAIVRNPLSTLASWSTVNIPVQRGRVLSAERINPDFRRRLDAEPDTLARQLIVLDWFYDRYLSCLPLSSIIKYEEIVATRGRALAVAVPEAAGLDEPLDSQNKSKLYDYELMARLGERLLATDGAYWQLYDRGSVEALLADVQTAQPTR